MTVLVAQILDRLQEVLVELQHGKPAVIVKGGTVDLMVIPTLVLDANWCLAGLTLLETVVNGSSPSLVVHPGNLFLVVSPA